MIEIRNVVKEFDGFRALDGLNMTVPDGAVYGLRACRPERSRQKHDHTPPDRNIQAGFRRCARRR